MSHICSIDFSNFHGISLLLFCIQIQIRTQVQIKYNVNIQIQKWKSGQLSRQFSVSFVNSHGFGLALLTSLTMHAGLTTRTRLPLPNASYFPFLRFIFSTFLISIFSSFHIFNTIVKLYLSLNFSATDMLMVIILSPSHRWGLRGSPLWSCHSTPTPIHNKPAKHSAHSLTLCSRERDIHSVAVVGVIGPTWDSACVPLRQASLLANPDKQRERERERCKDVREY